MVVISGVDLDHLNYTVLVPYNGTIATGGDSLTDNLNIWYEVSYLAPRRERGREREKRKKKRKRERQREGGDRAPSNCLPAARGSH